MINETVDDLVEILKVVNIDLGKPPFSKIIKADLEALVDVTPHRATGVHVWLNRHQQYGVEAFGLAV